MNNFSGRLMRIIRRHASSRNLIYLGMFLAALVLFALGGSPSFPSPSPTVTPRPTTQLRSQPSNPLARPSRTPQPAAVPTATINTKEEFCEDVCEFPQNFQITCIPSGCSHITWIGAQNAILVEVPQVTTLRVVSTRPLEVCVVSFSKNPCRHVVTGVETTIEDVRGTIAIRVLDW